jgi:hypothetical protein
MNTRNFRRHNFRRRGTRPQDQPKAPAMPASDCPLCAKPMREPLSALTHRASGLPAHFDCVLKELRESNEIQPQERICYLGGGGFGVLQFKNPGQASGKFTIQKKIQYELKDTPQEWKKAYVVR